MSIDAVVPKATSVRFSLALLLFVLVFQSSPASAQNEVDRSKLNTLLKVAVDRGGVSQARGGSLPLSGVTKPVPGYEVFIRGNVSRTELEALGVQVRTDLGDIKTAFVPETALGVLTQNPNVVRVEGAAPVKLEHDLSQPALGTAALRGPGPTFAGLNGAGVVVGAVDSGVDWSHADFEDQAGNTRFLKIWDQTDAIGPNPSGFTYGSEWTSANINAGTPRETDTSGHGTHVMGSAGGDGSATGNGEPAYQYAGAAPMSNLVMVKTTFFSTAVVDGVNYIFQQAGSNPAVANLSLGGQFGPHDGTSTFEQSLNALSGMGRIVVKSAGNDDGTGIHAEVIASAGPGTLARLLTIASGAGVVAVDGYYDQQDNISVSVRSPNGTLVGPLLRGTETQVTIVGQGTVLLENGTTSTNSGDWNIYVQLDDSDGSTVAPGNWDINLISVSIPAGGEVDMWAFVSTVDGLDPFFSVGSVNDELVGEPGNADSLVTTGAWRSKASWQSIDTMIYAFGTPPPVGTLAGFSSPGPTRDGRLKPDIAAPGTAIVSTMSSTTSPQVPLIVPDGLHTVLQGTSMAAPHVTGASAVMLQAKGMLYPSQIKQLIIAQAVADAFTGATPNNQWGHGKLVLNQAVPAALAQVAVDAQADGVRLSWTVTDGVELSKFAVERRVGQSGEFSLLNAEVNQERTGTMTRYSFHDREILPGLTYEYQIRAESELGELLVFGPYVAEVPASQKLSWSLAPPSPNPARISGLKFAFTAATQDKASLLIYDARGREVARPFDATVEPGAHTVSWDARGSNGSILPPGIYLVVFRGGGQELREKLVLLN